MSDQEMMTAPSKAIQSLINKAVDEHVKATDKASLAMETKNSAIGHAIKSGQALMKIKNKCKHGEWEPLFSEANRPFWEAQNGRFLSLTQAKKYIRVATFPTLSRSAVASDDHEEVNLDRTLTALSDATEEAEKQAKNDHRVKGTGKNEWYTPEVYLTAARNVMGDIDLDPATSAAANRLVGAREIFTVDDDGLTKPWHGRVWMNPPYSQPDVTNFAKKLVSEYLETNVEEAIALTHNYTDTAFFQHMLGSCSAVCFTRGRIAFVDADGNKAAPTQGQAFFYFGESSDKFFEEFSAFGAVLVRHGF